MLLRRAITGHKGLLALTVFLSVLMASASEINIQVNPPEPQENQTVTLNVTGITEKILFSEWYRGTEINAENQIIRYNADGTISQGRKYFNDTEIHSNGSMSIKSVTKDLEGDYTVYIQGISKPFQQTVQLKLTVKNGDDKGGSHLSGGAIAGIVIGVISVVVALIGGVVYLSKNKDSGPL